MTIRPVGLALALAATATGCSESSFQPPVAMQAVLTPVAGSGVSGTAAIMTQGSISSIAGIEVFAAGDAMTLGWQINLGTCAAPGRRLGGIGAYPDMTSGADSLARVERTFVSEPVRAQDRYHAVVLDAEARDVVLACGDFTRVQFSARPERNLLAFRG